MALHSASSTPLHLAAKNRNYEAMIVLMSHGADYSRRNNAGKVALDFVEDEEQLDRLRRHIHWLNRKNLLLFALGAFKEAVENNPRAEVFGNMDTLRAIASFLSS